ncbi:MAG: OmpH family outer membrane protein [Desulfotignum sp.]|nr:OmpH family outer membrane protein [Desulfotignum sp.]MCF8086868.1 OmpH family outer membrane protein [Desulfotignum sp.]MCF8136829.1 OmpH family outer membrane protein [Desulfotignum sp.]
MKRILFVTIISLLAISFVPMAFCADAVKIGVIDFEKIMKESSAGKMNQKVLNTKGTEFKNKLEKEKHTLDEISRAYEKEALVLSDEKKRERERDFRNQIEDFKIMQQDYANELKNLEIKMINDMQKAVFDIANELGKQEKYTLIIEKKNAGVIYIADRVDITDSVIKQYNADTAQGN